MIRCALYARVSTREKQFNQNQLDQLRTFADANGWKIVIVYQDTETGKKATRAAFQRLFSDAGRHKFDVLLFWSLDRFSREGAPATLRYLNLLAQAGVNFRSFTEPWLDTCGIFKDAMIAIFATLAKQEGIRISERTKAGVERARKNGKRIGRPRCAVHGEQLAVALRENWSLSRMARKLNISASTAARLKLKGAKH